MQLRSFAPRLMGRDRSRTDRRRARRACKAFLACDPLEGRVTPSAVGGVLHVAALVHAHHGHHGHHHNATSMTTPTGTGTSGGTATKAATTTGNNSSDTGTTTGTETGTTTNSNCPGGPGSPGGDDGSSTNTALTTALGQLRSDIATIEQASGTTVGELTTLRSGMNTLRSDGLTPSSKSALASFQDSLVTANANGTTLPSLSDFEAIFTSTPTDQQTTDLTTAYNDLVKAVQAANITSSDITTIHNDWSAVQAAISSGSSGSGSGSAPSFPYFSLVTGQLAPGGPGGPFGGHHGDGGFGGHR